MLGMSLSSAPPQPRTSPFQDWVIAELNRSLQTIRALSRHLQHLRSMLAVPEQLPSPQGYQSSAARRGSRSSLPPLSPLQSVAPALQRSPAFSKATAPAEY